MLIMWLFLSVAVGCVCVCVCVCVHACVRVWKLPKPQGESGSASIWLPSKGRVTCISKHNHYRYHCLTLYHPSDSLQKARSHVSLNTTTTGITVYTLFMKSDKFSPPMELELLGEYGRARAALPLSNYSYVSKTVQLYTSLSLIINYGSKTVCNKYIIIMMLHVWCALPPLSSCDNLSLLNNWSIIYGQWHL